jgi:hypothetical protein
MIVACIATVAVVTAYVVGETRGQARGHRECSELLQLDANLRVGS